MSVTKIYEPLHNANIDGYVTTSKDIHDPYSGQSQYEFNKSIKGIIGEYANAAAPMLLSIKSSSPYVAAGDDKAVTLTCTVIYNHSEDYTRKVATWTVDRTSSNLEKDLEWETEYNKKLAESKQPNIMRITVDDLDGDVAIFTIKATLHDGSYCENSISLTSLIANGGLILDLDNPMDAVLTNSYYVSEIDQEVMTHGSLTYNNTHIIPSHISFDYQGLPEGCATLENDSYEDFNVIVKVPQGAQLERNNAVIIKVSAEYNDVTIEKQTLFHIYADTDGVIYQLLPSSSKIRISSTGIYTPTELGCRVIKRTAQGVSYTTDEQDVSLGYIIDNEEEKFIIPNEKHFKLYGDDAIAPEIGIIYNLYENGLLIDTDYLPVTSDGVTGKSTIRLDLDNEMDAIPVDAEYLCMEDGTVTTDAHMYYGNDMMTFVRGLNTNIEVHADYEEEEQYVNNLTVTEEFYSNNTMMRITVAYKDLIRIPKKFTVTVNALGSYLTPDDEDYAVSSQTAKFSIVAVAVSEDNPIYQLLPSSNVIKVNKLNMRQPVNIGVTTKKRASRDGYVTTDYGYVRYIIDDAARKTYRKPLDTELIGDFIKFEYYDPSNNLLDMENIPVIFDGKDGSSGRGIKDKDEYYIATQSGSIIPDYDDEWIINEWPDESLFNETYPYLWNYEQITYINYGDDASVTRTTPTVITKYVKGIIGVEEYYLVSDLGDGIDVSYNSITNSYTDSTGLYEWVKDAIQTMDDTYSYLWNFERILYDNGTFTETSPIIIGSQGDSQFYINIDNQTDLVVLDPDGYVIPSNERIPSIDYTTVFSKTPSSGFTKPVPGLTGIYVNTKEWANASDYLRENWLNNFGYSKLIFKDPDKLNKKGYPTDGTNIGIVQLFTDFSAWYGNTRLDIKGIGFNYSNGDAIYAEMVNKPYDIYDIEFLNPGDAAAEAISEPDPKGSYYNPYKIGEFKSEKELADDKTVYLNAYIVGYRETSDSADITFGTMPSAVPYSFVIADSQSERNIKNIVELIFEDSDISEMSVDWEGIYSQLYKNVALLSGNTLNGGTSTLYNINFLQVILSTNKIIQLRPTFNTYGKSSSLNSTGVVIYIKPNCKLDEINWVRIAVDVEYAGKQRRLYTMFTIKGVANGQDAHLYNIVTSHDSIRIAKSVNDATQEETISYIPTLDTSIYCAIQLRKGNNSAQYINFWDTSAVNLYYSFDGGDYYYLPKDKKEYAVLQYLSTDNTDIQNGIITLYRSGSNAFNVKTAAEAFLKAHPNAISDYRIETYTQFTDGKIDVEETIKCIATEGKGQAETHYRDTSAYGTYPKWRLGDIIEFYKNSNIKTEDVVNTEDTEGDDENNPTNTFTPEFTKLSFKITDASLNKIDEASIEVLRGGKDGKSTVIADLSNEMVAVRVSSGEMTLKPAEFETTLSIYYGLSGTETIESITIGTSDLKEGDVTFTSISNGADWDGQNIRYTYSGLGTSSINLKFYIPEGQYIPTNNLNINITADTNIQDDNGNTISRSAIFTIHGVATDVLYQIVPDYRNIIKNDIDYRPDTLEYHITAEDLNMPPRTISYTDLIDSSLFVGYSIDGENSQHTNNGNIEAAHFCYFNAEKITNDEEYTQHSKDYIDEYNKKLAELCADTDEDMDGSYKIFSEYPHIKTSLIAESITFYLYQVYKYPGDTNDSLVLLDSESVPVTYTSYTINPNLVDGTFDGFLWNKTGDASIAESHTEIFKLPVNATNSISLTDEGGHSIISPDFRLSPNMEFIVSAEVKLVQNDGTPYQYTPTADEWTDEINFESGKSILIANIYNGQNLEASENIEISSNSISDLSEYIYVSWEDESAIGDKPKFYDWTLVKFNYSREKLESTGDRKVQFVYVNEVSGASCLLLVKHIKVEYGDTATTWCLSENDKLGRSVTNIYDFYWATSDANKTPHISDNNENFIDLDNLKYSEGKLESFKFTKDKDEDYIWYTSINSINPPYNEENRFLWNFELTLDQFGNILSQTIPALISTQGKSINKIIEYYTITDIGSNILAPNPKDQENKPNEATGNWEVNNGGNTITWKKGNNDGALATKLTNKTPNLWNFEYILYTDGTWDITDPMIISTFNSGYRVDLSNENDLIPVDERNIYMGAKPYQVSTVATLFNGSEKMAVNAIELTFKDTGELSGSVNAIKKLTLPLTNLGNTELVLQYYIPTGEDSVELNGVFEPKINGISLKDNDTLVITDSIIENIGDVSPYPIPTDNAIYVVLQYVSTDKVLNIKVNVPAHKDGDTLGFVLPFNISTQITLHNYGEDTYSGNLDDIFASANFSVVTLQAGADGIVYQLQPSVDSVSYDANTGTYWLALNDANGSGIENGITQAAAADKKITCNVLSRAGTGLTNVLNDSELSDLQLFVEYSINGAGWREYKNTTSIPVHSDTARKQISFRLIQNVEGNEIVIDKETIPFLKDGKDGTSVTNIHEFYFTTCSSTLTPKFFTTKELQYICDSADQSSGEEDKYPKWLSYDISTAIFGTTASDKKAYYFDKLLNSDTKILDPATTNYSHENVSIYIDGKNFMFNNYNPKSSPVYIWTHEKTPSKLSDCVLNYDNSSIQGGQKLEELELTINYDSYGQYLWNVEVTADQHNNIIKVTQPSLISANGKGISSIIEYYSINNVGSGVYPLGSEEYDDKAYSWVPGSEYNPESFRTSGNNNYLWNYEKIIYTDGTTFSTTPVIIGVYQEGLSIDLDNEMDIVAVQPNAASVTEYLLYNEEDTSVCTTAMLKFGAENVSLQYGKKDDTNVCSYMNIMYEDKDITREKIQYYKTPTSQIIEYGLDDNAGQKEGLPIPKTLGSSGEIYDYGKIIVHPYPVDNNGDIIPQYTQDYYVTSEEGFLNDGNAQEKWLSVLTTLQNGGVLDKDPSTNGSVEPIKGIKYVIEFLAGTRKHEEGSNVLVNKFTYSDEKYAFNIDMKAEIGEDKDAKKLTSRSIFTINYMKVGADGMVFQLQPSCKQIVRRVNNGNAIYINNSLYDNDDNPFEVYIMGRQGNNPPKKIVKDVVPADYELYQKRFLLIEAGEESTLDDLINIQLSEKPRDLSLNIDLNDNPNKESYTFKLYEIDASKTAILIDTETVPVISDGQNAENAYTCDLDNEMDSIAIDPTSGKPYTDTILKTTINLYEGKDRKQINDLYIDLTELLDKQSIRIFDDSSETNIPKNRVDQYTQVGDGTNLKYQIYRNTNNSLSIDIEFLFPADTTIDFKDNKHNIRIHAATEKAGSNIPNHKSAKIATFTILSVFSTTTYQLELNTTQIVEKNGVRYATNDVNGDIICKIVKTNYQGGINKSYVLNNEWRNTGLTLSYNYGKDNNDFTPAGLEDAPIEHCILHTAFNSIVNNVIFTLTDANNIVLDVETIPVVKDGVSPIVANCAPSQISITINDKGEILNKDIKFKRIECKFMQGNTPIDFNFTTLDFKHNEYLTYAINGDTKLNGEELTNKSTFEDLTAPNNERYLIECVSYITNGFIINIPYKYIETAANTVSITNDIITIEATQSLIDILGYSIYTEIIVYKNIIGNLLTMPDFSNDTLIGGGSLLIELNDNYLLQTINADFSSTLTSINDITNDNIKHVKNFKCPLLHFKLSYKYKEGTKLVLIFKNLYKNDKGELKDYYIEIITNNNIVIDDYIPSQYYTRQSTLKSLEDKTTPSYITLNGISYVNYAANIESTLIKLPAELTIKGFYMNWETFTELVVLRCNIGVDTDQAFVITNIKAQENIIRSSLDGYYFNVDETGLASIQSMNKQISAITQTADEIKNTVSGVFAVNLLKNSKFSKNSLNEISFFNIPISYKVYNEYKLPEGINNDSIKIIGPTSLQFNIYQTLLDSVTSNTYTILDNICNKSEGIPSNYISRIKLGTLNSLNNINESVSLSVDNFLIKLTLSAFDITRYEGNIFGISSISEMSDDIYTYSPIDYYFNIKGDIDIESYKMYNILEYIKNLQYNINIDESLEKLQDTKLKQFFQNAEPSGYIQLNGQLISIKNYGELISKLTRDNLDQYLIQIIYDLVYPFITKQAYQQSYIVGIHITIHKNTNGDNLIGYRLSNSKIQYAYACTTDGNILGNEYYYTEGEKITIAISNLDIKIYNDENILVAKTMQRSTIYDRPINFDSDIFVFPDINKLAIYDIDIYANSAEYMHLIPIKSNTTEQSGFVNALAIQNFNTPDQQISMLLNSNVFLSDNTAKYIEYKDTGSAIIEKKNLIIEYNPNLLEYSQEIFYNEAIHALPSGNYIFSIYAMPLLSESLYVDIDILYTKNKHEKVTDLIEPNRFTRIYINFTSYDIIGNEFGGVKQITLSNGNYCICMPMLEYGQNKPSQWTYNTEKNLTSYIDQKANEIAASVGDDMGLDITETAVFLANRTAGFSALINPNGWGNDNIEKDATTPYLIKNSAQPAGAGYLANGAIRWDGAGNLTVQGNVDFLNMTSNYGNDIIVRTYMGMQSSAIAPNALTVRQIWNSIIPSTHAVVEDSQNINKISKIPIYIGDDKDGFYKHLAFLLGESPLESLYIKELGEYAYWTILDSCDTYNELSRLPSNFDDILYGSGNQYYFPLSTFQTQWRNAFYYNYMLKKLILEGYIYLDPAYSIDTHYKRIDIYPINPRTYHLICNKYDNFIYYPYTSFFETHVGESYTSSLSADYYVQYMTGYGGDYASESIPADNCIDGSVGYCRNSMKSSKTIDTHIYDTSNGKILTKLWPTLKTINLFKTLYKKFLISTNINESADPAFDSFADIHCDMFSDIFFEGGKKITKSWQNRTELSISKDCSTYGNYIPFRHVYLVRNNKTNNNYMATPIFDEGGNTYYQQYIKDFPKLNAKYRKYYDESFRYTYKNYKIDTTFGYQTGVGTKSLNKNTVRNNMYIDGELPDNYSEYYDDTFNFFDFQPVTVLLNYLKYTWDPDEKKINENELYIPNGYNRIFEEYKKILLGNKYNENYLTYTPKHYNVYKQFINYIENNIHDKNTLSLPDPMLYEGRSFTYNITIDKYNASLLWWYNIYLPRILKESQYSYLWNSAILDYDDLYLPTKAFTAYIKFDNNVPHHRRLVNIKNMDDNSSELLQLFNNNTILQSNRNDINTLLQQYINKLNNSKLAYIDTDSYANKLDIKFNIPIFKIDYPERHDVYYGNIKLNKGYFKIVPTLLNSKIEKFKNNGGVVSFKISGKKYTNYDFGKQEIVNKNSETYIAEFGVSTYYWELITEDFSLNLYDDISELSQYTVEDENGVQHNSLESLFNSKYLSGNNEIRGEFLNTTINVEGVDISGSTKTTTGETVNDLLTSQYNTYNTYVSNCITELNAICRNTTYKISGIFASTQISCPKHLSYINYVGYSADSRARFYNPSYEDVTLAKLYGNTKLDYVNSTNNAILKLCGSLPIFDELPTAEYEYANNIYIKNSEFQVDKENKTCDLNFIQYLKTQVYPLVNDIRNVMKLYFDNIAQSNYSQNITDYITITKKKDANNVDQIFLSLSYQEISHQYFIGAPIQDWQFSTSIGDLLVNKGWEPADINNLKINDGLTLPQYIQALLNFAYLHYKIVADMIKNFPPLNPVNGGKDIIQYINIFDKYQPALDTLYTYKSEIGYVTIRTSTNVEKKYFIPSLALSKNSIHTQYLYCEDDDQYNTVSQDFTRWFKEYKDIGFSTISNNIQVHPQNTCLPYQYYKKFVSNLSRVHISTQQLVNNITKWAGESFINMWYDELDASYILHSKNLEEQTNNIQDIISTILNNNYYANLTTDDIFDNMCQLYFPKILTYEVVKYENSQGENLVEMAREFNDQYPKARDLPGARAEYSPNYNYLREFSFITLYHTVQKDGLTTTYKIKMRLGLMDAHMNTVTNPHNMIIKTRLSLDKAGFNTLLTIYENIKNSTPLKVYKTYDQSLNLGQMSPSSAIYNGTGTYTGFRYISNSKNHGVYKSPPIFLKTQGLINKWKNDYETQYKNILSKYINDENATIIGDDKNEPFKDGGVREYKHLEVNITNGEDMSSLLGYILNSIAGDNINIYGITNGDEATIDLDMYLFKLLIKIGNIQSVTSYINYDEDETITCYDPFINDVKRNIDYTYKFNTSSIHFENNIAEIVDIYNPNNNTYLHKTILLNNDEINNILNNQCDESVKDEIQKLKNAINLQIGDFKLVQNGKKLYYTANLYAIYDILTIPDIINNIITPTDITQKYSILKNTIITRWNETDALNELFMMLNLIMYYLGISHIKLPQYIVNPDYASDIPYYTMYTHMKNQPVLLSVVDGLKYMLKQRNVSDIKIDALPWSVIGDYNSDFFKSLTKNGI